MADGKLGILCRILGCLCFDECDVGFENNFPINSKNATRSSKKDFF